MVHKKRCLALATLIIVAWCLATVLCPGAAGNVQAETVSPTPGHIVHIPLIVVYRPQEERSGDWVVAGNEVVQDMDVLLDGNLVVRNGGSLTLHNVRLTLNAAYTFQYGIRVESGAAITIASGTVISAAHDAGRISFRVQEDSHFVMRDSELHGCGSGTPYVSGWDTSPGLEIHTAGAVIERNLFAGNFTGVNLMPGGDQARITGNRFIGNEWNGVSTWHASGAYIAENSFIDGIGGIFLYEGSNEHVITANSFVRNPEAGIFAFGAWDNEISNNHFLNAGWAAVDIAKLSGNNRILNNTIDGAGNGINLHQSRNNTVQGNLMTNVDQGIELGDAEDNLIANNEIAIDRGNYATYGALLLYHSANNQILNNKVQIIGKGNAVLLFGDAVSNTLQSNVITASFRGLALHAGADSNTVVSNTISVTDEQAIVVADSTQNVIHHNSFLQSGCPAYGSSGNAWDDGAEGNFWRDYRGSGVYAITPGSVDHHPLVSPTVQIPAPVVPLSPIPLQPLFGISQHITEPTVIANQAITIDAALFVEAGGSLTLTNSTLWISGGNADGAIRLLAGGEFNVYSSTIRATEHGGNYLFTAERGSSLTIKDSVVRDVGFSTGMDWGALYVKSDQVDIEGTLFTDSFGGPVIIASAQSTVRIIGNDFSGLYRALFLGNPGSDDQHDIVIAGNHVSNIIGAAVSINGGHNITFANNMLDTVWWGSGIGLSGNDHTVVSNTFINQWSGASINTGGHGDFIASNVITGGQATAIAVTGEEHTVVSNSITDAIAGISLNQALNCLVEGNRVTGVSGPALHLGEGSYTNTMRANTVVSAVTGVYVAQTTAGNLLYQNNIMSNAMQVWDFGTNRWDDQGRGNYWSDYAGSDNDGNGIGDTPYSIPPNGIDHYPLMRPY